jgi:hypothetical protein
MSIVHRATLEPSKQELVAAWLPTRPWASGIEISTKVAEYRFDDPQGEVGVETILFADDAGATVQVPLTYRGAPLEGAEEHLVGTTEHSVLGRRWVYDGCADPVWAATLMAAILTGGTQSQMYLLDGDEQVAVPPRMTVRGSGEPGADVPEIAAITGVRDEGMTTVASAAGLELAVVRVLGAAVTGDATLTGEIGDRTAVLAALRRTS